MNKQQKKYRYNSPDCSDIRKDLRSHGTSAEGCLWRMLKNRKIGGYKFRRQYSVGQYILDFYCPKVRLCIELDGQPHFTDSGMESDNRRTEYLGTVHQIHVLRFENRAVFEYPESVLNEIEKALYEFDKR